MNSRIFNAIVLNDYGNGKNYATYVRDKIKTLETRMMLFQDRFIGDMVICCGSKSLTRQAGKALCLVHWGKGRKMIMEDAPFAMIECVEGRYVYPLTNHRLLSREFTFSKRKVGGSFQSIFQIELPEDVTIIE